MSLHKTRDISETLKKVIDMRSDLIGNIFPWDNIGHIQFIII